MSDHDEQHELEVKAFIMQMIMTMSKGLPQGLIVAYTTPGKLNCMITGTSAEAAAELMHTLLDKCSEHPEINRPLAMKCLQSMVKTTNDIKTAETTAADFIKTMMEKNDGTTLN